jgi:serine/threonine protein kinase
MDNGDIGQYIRHHGHDLTDELRLCWAKQAAEGLAALHSIGAIHCDFLAQKLASGPWPQLEGC